MVKVNVVPRPGELSTSIFPLSNSTYFFMIKRPTPTRARASLRFLGQPIQRPSIKVPSTPRPQSHCAQAPHTLSSGADAPTHRHRYHPMPSMPKGNSALPCQPACSCTMGFFVMIDQQTKDRAVAPLCARASASVRPVLSLYPFLPRSRLCFATRSRPIVALKTARYFHYQWCSYVCFSQPPSYNPHRQTSLLHPPL